MLNQATKVRLLAQETDSQHYTTYVFEILDNDDMERLDTKYIMCVRWPNWQHRILLNGEEGFLQYKEIRAGIDTWYNGTTQIPYKYNNVQFTSFIAKQPDMKHDFKL
jgi:hypothetical protein